MQNKANQTESASSPWVMRAGGAIEIDRCECFFFRLRRVIKYAPDISCAHLSCMRKIPDFDGIPQQRPPKATCWNGKFSSQAKFCNACDAHISFYHRICFPFALARSPFVPRLRFHIRIGWAESRNHSIVIYINSHHIAYAAQARLFTCAFLPHPILPSFVVERV